MARHTAVEGSGLWTDLRLETMAGLRRLKEAARRLEARVRFALERRSRVRPLSDEQVGRYHRDGYLLVSGLIPEKIVSLGEAAMWQSLGADAHASGTWAILGPHPHVVRDERLTATCTDAVRAAAAQLAGEDVATFRRPTHAFTVNRPPTCTEWRRHEPHLDRTIPEMRDRTFPRPYRIGAILYLTTVQPRGGGTIVWPGSHLVLEALARSDPRKYKYLAALKTAAARFASGDGVELTPSRGDVLFHHYLAVHASSDNTSGAPRLALDHKW